MNINELTIGEIKEINALLGGNKNQDKHPFELGKNYLIRTVTMIQLGKLVAVYDKELVLEQAAWIADTGKFSEALEQGIENINSSEIELFIKPAIIGRGALIDATEYIRKMPTETK